MTTQVVGIPNLADFDKTIKPMPQAKDVWVKGTIYGESGVGKTRLSVTKKMGGKVLFANVEDGYLSVTGSDLQKKDLKTFADFRGLFLRLKKGDHPFDTVFVDSFTEAQKFAVAEIAADKAAAGRDKDPYKLSLEDYGLATERLRQWMWDMRSLPMHVFYVCLSKPMIGQGEIVAKQTLAVTQKLGEALFAYSDLVGYLDTAEVQKPGSDERIEIRRLYLRKSREFVAKARLPGGADAPPYINVPTLDKIITLYRGETKKKGEDAA